MMSWSAGLKPGAYIDRREESLVCANKLCRFPLFGGCAITVMPWNVPENRRKGL